MKIILKERIENLGFLGDIISVKPGYARNFLVPYGKAVQATKKNIAIFEEQKTALAKLEKKRLSDAKLQAGKISGKTFTINTLAGDGGKLFGSVGTKEVAHAIMSATNITIEKRNIRMPNGIIRHTGEFKIFIHLYTGIDAEILINVKSK